MDEVDEMAKGKKVSKILPADVKSMPPVQLAEGFSGKSKKRSHEESQAPIETTAKKEGSEKILEPISEKKMKKDEAPKKEVKAKEPSKKPSKDASLEPEEPSKEKAVAKPKVKRERSTKHSAASGIVMKR